MDRPVELPSKLMVLIALLQGFTLLYLHQAIELHYWPHQQPQWLFAFYSAALIWPTMLLLGLNNSKDYTFLRLSLFHFDQRFAGLLHRLPGHAD